METELLPSASLLPAVALGVWEVARLEVIPKQCYTNNPIPVRVLQPLFLQSRTIERAAPHPDLALLDHFTSKVEAVRLLGIRIEKYS